MFPGSANITFDGCVFDPDEILYNGRLTIKNCRYDKLVTTFVNLGSGTLIEENNVGGSRDDNIRLRKAKTADQVEDSTTGVGDTLTDDDILKAYQLEPNTYYKVTGFLKVTAASTNPDIKFRLQTATAFVEDQWTWDVRDDGGAVTQIHGGGATTATFSAALTATTHNISFNGTILTHAVATSGSHTVVDFQWAQNTAHADDLTVEKGSWLAFEPVST